MKHLIVPTDFSPCAAQAERAALDLATTLGARLTFLHCITGSNSVDYDLKNLNAQANELLDNLVKEAKERHIIAEKSLVSLNGKTLAHCLEDIQDGLVVMGSHGTSGFRRFLFGSNTAKILRTAKTPILVVQEKMPEPVAFKTLIFASGLEPDTKEAFRRVCLFAKKIGVENIHLLSITTPQNFQPSSKVSKDMSDFVAGSDWQTLWLHNYNHFNVEEGIIEFAKNIEADLIAVANHGRKALSSYMIESIPDNLVKYAELPVLSIRI